jgi:hypothetical protein
MKQTPALDKAQAAMRPGVIAQAGFLGPDARKLADILAEDQRAVAALGLTHEGIAARMLELRAAGESGLGLAIAVAPHFEVAVEDVRGMLPCPFGHEGLFPKINVTVRNLSLGRTVVFTELQRHLIGAHGFYEGRGSPYRLDPADLAAVLDVKRQPGGQATLR